MPDEVVDQPIDQEPEGTRVDPTTGAKHVPLDALIATRTESKKQTKALSDRLQQLEQALPAIQQKAQRADVLEGELRGLKERLNPPERDTGPKVGDDEAAQFARDYELYDATTGQPDVTRAKRIIARNRHEAAQTAQQIVQSQLGPVQEAGAVAASRQQFARFATETVNGTAPTLEFQQILAQKWASLPAALTQQEEIGAVLRDAALGECLRLGKTGVPPSDREPMYTEDPGGRRPGAYQMTEQERRIAKDQGLTDQKWTESAKKYTPGTVNVLE